MNGFLYTVLNDGLVDERQHLFRLRLGSGKKTDTEPCGGNNCLANFRDGHKFLS